MYRNGSTHEGVVLLGVFEYTEQVLAFLGRVVIGQVDPLSDTPRHVHEGILGIARHQGLIVTCQPVMRGSMWTLLYFFYILVFVKKLLSLQ